MLSLTVPVTVTDVALITAFASGDVIVTEGPEVALAIVLLSEELLPTVSLASTVIVLTPADKLTDLLNEPSEDSVMLEPLTLTLATPFESATLPETVIELPAVTRPLLGDVIVIVGPVVSLITVTVLVVLRSTALVATIVIVLEPSVRLTDFEKLPLDKVTEVPFTFTLDTVLTLSLTVPVTVTDVAFSTELLEGFVIVTVGPEVALLTVLVTVVVFPAVSVATIVIVLLPAERVTGVEKLPFEVTVTDEPLTFRLATPFASLTVPETLAEVEVVTRLSTGVDTFSVGPV